MEWPKTQNRVELQRFLQVSTGGSLRTTAALSHLSPLSSPPFASLTQLLKLSSPSLVEVDASESGLRAVLSQRSAEDHRLHPCAFYSQCLTPAECNYEGVTGGPCCLDGVEALA